ncbi:hypothetical protein K440DRAFT_643427 [Wilcoxina mikolae CBS 423.85]|nr:hypothetical protein K440DRAFT_643427 [Wilcoxina mikolae CBS 423.85]
MATPPSVNEKPPNPPITFTSVPSLPPDVAIEIFDSTYHLHSTVLRLCSGFFECSLSDTWWKSDNTHSSPDGIKFRYRLQFDKDDPSASMVEPVTPGEMMKAEEREIKEQEEEQQEEETEEEENEDKKSDWASNPRFWLPPSIPVRIWRETVDEVIETLLQLAEVYCSLPVVSDTVYNALIESYAFGQWSICDDPVMHLRIASKIRNTEIFNDAFVHLVGQSEILKTDKEELPDGFYELALREHIRIQGLKEALYKQLAYSMTPAALQSSSRKRPAIEKHTQREVEIAFEKLEEVGEMNFYTTVSNIKGPWAEKYLKNLVSPLLEDNLMLDINNSSCSTLTCGVFWGEYPWENGEELQ